MMIHQDYTIGTLVKETIVPIQNHNFPCSFKKAWYLCHPHAEKVLHTIQEFTSNTDKVNNKYYLQPASLEEIVCLGV
ncbi:hypothetical protein KY289_030564 [Solanum tuberosum]|nr:hypothetical protein KY289_030564 [Solanum tuberosum]